MRGMRTGYEHYEPKGRSTVSAVRVSEAVSADRREESALVALTRRLDGRGFTRAAKIHQEDMRTMEEQARTASPAYYRWEEFCADGRGATFRHGDCEGRRVMDVDDFANYFKACRSDRPRSETEIDTVAIVPARTREESGYSADSRAVAKAQQRTAKAGAVDRAVAVAKDWLRPDDPARRLTGSRRRVPVSVLAAFVVITVSLMLIVSSSVMVATAKRQVSDLGDEVAALEKEAELMTDKLESQINYLEIYKIATEQYGMISADYVNSLHVDRLPENTVERLEEDEESEIGLATLLSAIGIRLDTEKE